MRGGACLIAILLTGCAASQPAEPVQPSAEMSPMSLEGSQVAAALVFTAPDANPVELPREYRQAGAFVGYDQTITTYSYLRIDDSLREDADDDRYERRSVTTRFGISTR